MGINPQDFSWIQPPREVLLVNDWRNSIETNMTTRKKELSNTDYWFGTFTKSWTNCITLSTTQWIYFTD